jgi:para-nitrobenzyl esterase
MAATANENGGASRRAVLGVGSALALAAMGEGAKARVAAAPPPRPTSPLGGGGSGDIFPVVETTCGKVQGTNAGINEFKFVPYGAPTGGPNRYMPPRKPAPPGLRQRHAGGE